MKEPLSLVSALVSSKNAGAADLLALMAECSPAREVVIALQEALEHVASQYDDDAEDDAHRKLAKSLVQIIDLYSAGRHPV